MFFLSIIYNFYVLFFFFQAEDGIRDTSVTGVQTCALPIFFPPRERTAIGPAVVLAAGTTDRGPASEAATVLRAYGAEVARFDDVGVAGLHRLLDPAKLGEIGRASCRCRVV